MSRVLAMIVLALVALAALAGCDDDEAKVIWPSTKVEVPDPPYGVAMREAQENADITATNLLEQVPDPDRPQTELARFYGRYYRGYLPILRDNIAEVTPPKRARAAHDRVLGGLRVLAERENNEALTAAIVGVLETGAAPDVSDPAFGPALAETLPPDVREARVDLVLGLEELVRLGYEEVGDVEPFRVRMMTFADDPELAGVPRP